MAGCGLVLPLRGWWAGEVTAGNEEASWGLCLAGLHPQERGLHPGQWEAATDILGNCYP